MNLNIEREPAEKIGPSWKDSYPRRSYKGVYLAILAGAVVIALACALWGTPW